MKHDELLSKILDTMDNSSDWEANGSTQLALEALRAVVELHEPTNLGMINHEKYWCNVCHKEAGDYDCVNSEYPCSTIQAIEKELA